VVETLIKCRVWRFSIKIDEGQVIKANFLLAAVANGRYYGGGMMPAPMAEIDDGCLNVCLAEEKSRLEIIKFLPRFIKGRHIDIEGVHLFKGRKVEIECDGDTPLNMDGEVEMVRKAVFEIIPEGISVVVPLHQLS
jgi:diacylglycerol kinase (ATP)